MLLRFYTVNANVCGLPWWIMWVLVVVAFAGLGPVEPPAVTPAWIWISLAMLVFSTALGLARGSDLIASVPERHTASLREGMHSFALPFHTAAFTVSLLWHPRFSADPAHRWLRDLVLEICRRSE